MSHKVLNKTCQNQPAPESSRQTRREFLAYLGNTARSATFLCIGTGLSGFLPSTTAAAAGQSNIFEKPWATVNGIQISGCPRKIIPELDEPMTRLYAETGMAGQACARAFKHRLIFTRAYGWAYKGHPEETVPTSEWIPMTTTQSRPIGSCSKSLTAVAILRLIEQGHLSPATKVIDYLGLEPILDPPDYARFDTRWLDIRIKHVLNHTSGIPNVGRKNFPKALLDKKIKSGEIKPVNGDQLTVQDSIRLMMRFPLEFRPGQKFKYSAGYELLVPILEKACQMRCDQCIEQLVFQPLGITSHTTWVYEGSRVNYEAFSRKHRFYGYGFNPEKQSYEWAYGDVVSGNNRIVSGGGIGGGFWCLSIVDLLRFVTFWPGLFKNRSLVTAATTDQTPDHSHYGLGFCYVREKKNTMYKWGHNGSLGGLKAEMRFDTATQVSGAELWNSDHPQRKEAVKIADRFIELYRENARIDRMEDLWPQYGFTQEIPESH